MSTQQNPKPALILAGAVMVATAGAASFLMLAPAEPEPQPFAGHAQVPAAAPAQPPTNHRAVEPQVEPEVAEQPSEAGRAKPQVNRMARDLQREQIWAALRTKHGLQPAAPGNPAPSASAASLLPSLDRAYIRTEVSEPLVPALTDCYDAARRDDPTLNGKVTMKFTVIGAETIGSVIEEARVDEGGTTLASPGMHECMIEAMLAVSFPAPDSDGRVEVSFPFVFVTP
jgi:hypothetical protein